MTCSFTPTCDFCNVKMFVKWAKLAGVRFTGQPDDEPGGYAVDVCLQCPECGHVLAFGIAVSAEEAERIRHG